jgi:hypothetical protein
MWVVTSQPDVITTVGTNPAFPLPIEDINMGVVHTTILKWYIDY